MTEGTDEGAVNGDGVYRPLEDQTYDSGITPEKDVAVPVSVQHSSAPRALGAKAIRWNWWALALGVSVLLWIGIAQLITRL